MPLSRVHSAAAAIGALLAARRTLAQHAPAHVVAATAAAAAAPDAPCPDWRQCGMGKYMKCCEPNQECWNEWFDYSCHNKTESRPSALAALQGLFSGKSTAAASPSGEYSGSAKELGITFKSTVRVDSAAKADMSIAASGLMSKNHNKNVGDDQQCDCDARDPGYNCKGHSCPGKSCGEDTSCTWDADNCMQAGEGGGVSPSF